MRAHPSRLGLIGALALAGLPSSVAAQPVGEEFQVNTYTTEHQRAGGSGHVVAADANGNFLVVWNGAGQGDDFGIFGQRYDSAGTPLGAEFQINSYTTAGQGHPSVASGASGNFVVVWASSNQDGADWGIFGQRYNSAGVPLGTEFRVNSYTTDYQIDPSVASDASGNFVVAWASGYSHKNWYGEIFAQRYDSQGVPHGGEFRVNTSNDNFANPSIASDASGNFVVVWESTTGYGDYNAGVFGQRFDNEGLPRGSEFQVDGPFGDGFDPSVASDASGNFVVVWNDGNIFGQRYDSAGNTLGSDFRVNTYSPLRRADPSVASDAVGNFTVAWANDIDQDGDDSGVFGQRFDSDGVMQGEEFQINAYTTGPQEEPSVGATGVDQFVVVWTSGNGQDGSGAGVFGRRYDFGAAQAITVVSPNSEVKWRIGSLERIRWTHNLGADATFRIELDRDDDGEYEELIAAAAPVDGPAKGSFAWIVTGPRAPAARVRVSWTDDREVADAGDTTFQIRPAPLASPARAQQR